MSQNNWPFVINVGNSIIGVTVLAMPFCFQACGIVLGTLLLLFATWLTIVSCDLLMKAGVNSRRRSYSLLAAFTHGALGKLIVEIGMIGLQLGTLIAQVVIIGDLGPAIVSKATGLQNSDNLRTGLIVFLCLFVGLPLGLLKDVRTLSKTSSLCIAFYAFFAFYIVTLSIPNLVAGDWYNRVNFWRMEGFFQCLPIFSFAFGCQTQLFIVYDALAEPSLKRINGIVSSAVNMCTVAYLLVGFFGYIAFCNVGDLSGDIINHFKQDTICDSIKLLFVFSIAVTIPLIVFPCRASLFTLCFPHAYKVREDMPGGGKIPETHFKVITIVIIVGSMIIGILIPNIEFVLGFNGATMGTLICYIFPALFFLSVMSDKAEGLFKGKAVLVLGLTIMIASTYTLLTKESTEVKIDKLVTGDSNPVIDIAKLENSKKFVDTIKGEMPVANNGSKILDKQVNSQERQEPPIPQEPQDDFDKGKKDKDDNILKKAENDIKDTAETDKHKQSLHEQNEKQQSDIDRTGDKTLDKNMEHGDKNDPDETKHEEKLIEAEKKQDEILAKLEQQQEQQEKLIQEQKEILEQLKEHKDSHKEEEVNPDNKQLPLNQDQIQPVQNNLQLPANVDQNLQQKQQGDAHVPQQHQQAGGLNLQQNNQFAGQNLQQNQQLGGQNLQQNQQVVGQNLQQNQQVVGKTQQVGGQNLQINQQGLVQNLQQKQQGVVPNLQQNQQGVDPNLQQNQQGVVQNLQQNQQGMIQNLQQNQQGIVPNLQQNKQNIAPQVNPQNQQHIDQGQQMHFQNQQLPVDQMNMQQGIGNQGDSKVNAQQAYQQANIVQPLQVNNEQLYVNQQQDVNNAPKNIPNNELPSFDNNQINNNKIDVDKIGENSKSKYRGKRETDGTENNEEQKQLTGDVDLGYNAVENEAAGAVHNLLDKKNDAQNENKGNNNNEVILKDNNGQRDLKQIPSDTANAQYGSDSYMDEMLKGLKNKLYYSKDVINKFGLFKRSKRRL